MQGAGQFGCVVCFNKGSGFSSLLRTTALALELVAGQEAKHDINAMASAIQAPYASSTMGTQTHPRCFI